MEKLTISGYYCIFLISKIKILFSLNNKGVALVNLNKSEEALKCLDKAIELDSNDSLAFKIKGLALSNLNKYEEAIKCFDESIKLNKNDTSAYLNKGFALEKLNRFDEVLIILNKYISLFK